MKTFLLFLFISSLGFSQSVEYGKPMKNGSYTLYRTKSDTSVKVGDTLHINPPNGNHYVYIEQAGVPAGTVLAHKDIVIKKIKVYGTKGHKPNVIIGFKGYGLTTVYIAYELALETGEIYNPNDKITSDEALVILKEKKELLDLELISQKEYDKIKAELSPITLSKK